MRMTIWTEIKNLVWLQWRLTVSSFRSGQKQDVLRILGYALLILLLVPGLIIFNALLIWIYRSLAPGPASEVVTVIMSFIIMMWLLTPASNTQLVEPFSMPKLFSFPISLNGLVLGSLVVNLFSVGFLAIIPFLISVSAGTIRSIPSTANSSGAAKVTNGPTPNHSSAGTSIVVLVPTVRSPRSTPGPSTVPGGTNSSILVPTRSRRS